MAVDMTEVRQLFFEESFENLDNMESNLLDLSIGPIDKELVNSIFRVAHSIKGGAGIFKFEHIINFAHVTETLLDEMRKAEHLVTQPLIDLLLRSVDIMRMILTSLQEGTKVDEQEVLDCENQLKSFLKTPIEVPFLEGHKSTSSTNNTIIPPTIPPIDPAEMLIEGWHINFKPYPTLLATGNDPINLFRELANLGTLEIFPNSQQIPSFLALEPQTCYLSWELNLHGQLPKTVVEEIFEWVEGDCDLEITPLKKNLPSQIAPNLHPISLVPSGKSSQREELSASSQKLNAEASSTSLRSAPIQLGQPVEIKTEKVETETQSAPPFTLPLSSSMENPTLSIEAINSPIPSLPLHLETLSLPLEDPVKPPLDSSLDTHTHRNNSSEATSIRVGIDKIDDLINIVGELVITQSMLDQVGEDFDNSKLIQLRDGLSQLERNTRELQESVMRVRMLPISYSFNRFPRLVHDLSVQLGKKVELKLSGIHTELDKTVLEKMSDPLVHLVRNALDHGIEIPLQRQLVGKSETGLLHLHAFHQGGNIMIQISDDGAGIDLEKIRQKAIQQKLIAPEDRPSEEQLYELIFQPGFSTATQVSDLSGRGVGMDVVRRNIRSLGGAIEVQSTLNKGTVFKIRLPLTLAILDGQLVRVGQEIYILSLLSIIESLRIKPQLVNLLAGKAEVYKLRDDYIPILRLYDLFQVTPGTTQLDQGLLVIVEGDGQKIGLFVDELLSQQQIVIKSLETNFKKIQGISGATILGDGSVALILDVAGLIQLFHGRTQITVPRSASFTRNLI